jgi:hypothetical protein
VRDREREHVEGKEKKNGQAIRLLGYPEEKKREDSFFIPFPLFFFFTFLIKCYIINACGLKGSNI